MGGPQAEADGVVSFSPKYPLETSLKLNYLNEAEALAVKTTICLGSTNEPQAERGNLCVYRGAQKPAEAENDKEIVEPGAEPVAGVLGDTFATPAGEFIHNKVECNKENGQCQTSLLVVFRTKGFTSGPIGTVAAPAYLDARGSWAVTAN
jgi:hypothetical protein